MLRSPYASNNAGGAGGGALNVRGATPRNAISPLGSMPAPSFGSNSSPVNAAGGGMPPPPPNAGGGGMTPASGGGPGGTDWWSMGGQDPGGMFFSALPQGTEEMFGAAPVGFSNTLRQGGYGGALPNATAGAGRKGRMQAVQSMYQGMQGGGGGMWGF